MSLSPEELAKALAAESKEFEKAFRWLEEHMPPRFLEELNPDLRLLVARHLLSYPLENHFSLIQLPEMAIVLLQEEPEADLKVIKHYDQYPIRHYRAFVSNEPPPGEKKGLLRIAVVYFKEPTEKLTREQKGELTTLIRSRNPDIAALELEELLETLSPRLIRSMTQERLKIALDLFFRASTRDECQYEVRKNGECLQLILAWREVPKSRFFHKLALIVQGHKLVLQRILAADVRNVLVLSLALQGEWEKADIHSLMTEIALVKYFEIDDAIYTHFVQTALLTGNEAHLVRNFITFAHQALVYADPNLFSLDHVAQDLCRHPELTVQLCKAFQAKFHPKTHDLTHFEKLKIELFQKIAELDTGQPLNDLRRKSTLTQVLQFITFTLKTNFYRTNKTAFAFRLDPRYLDQLPYDRKEKFPELPYGIFFIRGMHFLGFNIRFKDLARGGVRTVLPDRMESYHQERNTIFSEAYNLAYTQQKKNKDIPEGGAKTAILLKPIEIFAAEEEIYRKTLENTPAIEEKLKAYRNAERKNYLLFAQRCFIESLLTLVNCDETGKLHAASIVDYWNRPEYIYLGPDENMSNEMIVWIGKYATECDYKPGRTFMSSQPGAGINHKEFGVTSHGVHLYLQEVLRFLGLEKEKFTVKISGGPDGDVAGNEILNLYKSYPKTAKLLALTDVSGTIYDPEGLDLAEMAQLFHKALPIRHYPAAKLSEGGFLLDLNLKREQSAYIQQTLCLRKQNGKLTEEWLSGNEMNHLYRSNVHQVKSDIFIPAGGRPRTLNESNLTTFLDPHGNPTARAIVEGANLYLAPLARRSLEKLGTLIFIDSSCNKGGVICSSFEVLAGLTLTEKEFFQEKEQFVKEVLAIIGRAAQNEARLLLETHKRTHLPLSQISELISEKINLFKYQLLDHLDPHPLPSSPNHFLIRSLIRYCPPLLQQKYRERILQLPDIHKKAMIACSIASHLVYTRGIEWSPSVADILATFSEQA